MLNRLINLFYFWNEFSADFFFMSLLEHPVIIILRFENLVASALNKTSKNSVDTHNAYRWEFVFGGCNLNSSKREPTRPYHAILPRANLALDFQTDTLLVSYQQPYALRISELTSHPLKLSALPETR